MERKSGFDDKDEEGKKEGSSSSDEPDALFLRRQQPKDEAPPRLLEDYFGPRPELLKDHFNDAEDDETSDDAPKNEESDPGADPETADEPNNKDIHEAEQTITGILNEVSEELSGQQPEPEERLEQANPLPDDPNLVAGPPAPSGIETEPIKPEPTTHKPVESTSTSPPPSPRHQPESTPEPESLTPPAVGPTPTPIPVPAPSPKQETPMPWGNATHNNRPPSPPIAPGSVNPNNAPIPPWQPEPNHNRYNAQNVAHNPLTHRDLVRAERAGLGRGLIAGALTAWVVKGYLDGRKLKRYKEETEQRIQEQRDRIEAIHTQNQAMQNEQNRKIEHHNHQLQEQSTVGIPAPPHEDAKKLEQQAKQIKPIVEQASKPNEQSPVNAERTVHSAWHDVRVDKQGHEIQGATYGEAFRQEQAHEVVAGAPAAKRQAATKGVHQSAQQYYFDGSGYVPVADPNHELQPPAQIDVGHRLPAPKHPVRSVVTSPWLWLAVGVLMAAFFLAASI